MSLHFKMSKLFPLLILLAWLSTTLTACSTPASGNDHLAMMPIEQMPAEVQTAPQAVREAYQFAAANPDVMKQIPCYCGCGDIGHTSNYACYVSHVDERGVVTFDNHALGCSICVDITRDTMRLLKEGRAVPEIRAYVDATYGKYGVSNMP